MMWGRTLIRLYHSGFQLNKNIKSKTDKLKQLKGHKGSSQEWMERQLSDIYVEKAKLLNYRSRAAFKLIEINDKYKILRPGHLVVDCGCSPGAWTQVAVRETESVKRHRSLPQGLVIGVDLQHTYPIEGATVLGNLDFRAEETQGYVKSLLRGKKLNCVLSDMAPKASGVKSLDNEQSLHLCYAALRFALHTSDVGASVLMKVFDGANTKGLENAVRRFYKNVKYVKPSASRAESSEKYLLGRDFVGLADSSPNSL